MAYVVEVLDLMWEFGYDGHNLEEIARYYHASIVEFDNSPALYCYPDERSSGVVAVAFVISTSPFCSVPHCMHEQQQSDSHVRGKFGSSDGVAWQGHRRRTSTRWLEWHCTCRWNVS